jgi:F-type H+-transporting ATPase subunit delta
MAELITIARPYARAAFEAANAAGALPEWSVFLARAAVAVRDAQIEPLIGNPRVRSDELIGLLLAVAVQSAGASSAARPAAGPTSEEQRNFLGLLAHNRRLALLPEIAAQYELLRAQAEHVADVQVSAARELTAGQATALSAALERRLGRSVRLHVSVDATLLGGAVVHYGDYVVDGSLRGRLERLAVAVAGT